MAKASKTVNKTKGQPVKEKPTKLNITFEEFIKRAVNTPIKNSKVNKK